jgi:hypothetical protein
VPINFEEEFRKFDIFSNIVLYRYLQFIQFYIDNPVDADIICENHHILPKSIFPNFEINPENLVRLPLRSHYLAHWMLAKILSGKMWQAFQLMGRVHKHNSAAFETLKLQNLEHNQCPTIKAKISKSIKKLWEDPEYRKRQSSIQRGIKNSRFTPYTLYDNNNQPIITILFKPRETLKLLGYPPALAATSKDKPYYYDLELRQKFVQTSFKKSGNLKFQNWFVMPSLT